MNHIELDPDYDDMSFFIVMMLHDMKYISEGKASDLLGITQSEYRRIRQIHFRDNGPFERGNDS